MPVRSLTSPVLKWPDAQKVAAALQRWAARVAQARPEVVAVGYFGSYARGDWGVGSDLDVLILIADSPQPFEMRASDFDTGELPVPTDVLVYTPEEWETMKRAGRFAPRVGRETVWVYVRKP